MFSCFHVDLPVVSVCLAMIGKMCISGSVAMVAITTLEVFPTVTRHVGLASGLAAARVGGIMAPYITLLVRTCGL